MTTKTNMFEAIIKKNGQKEPISYLIKSKNLSDAYKSAKLQGKVLEVKKYKSLGAHFGGMKPRMRISFLQRWAMMEKSDVGMSTALLSIERAFSGATSRIALKLRSNLEQGGKIKDALDEMIGDFPKPTVTLIKSGMDSGDFGQALEDAAEFEEEMARVRQESTFGLFLSITTYLFACILILATAFWFTPWFMGLPFMQATGGVNIDWLINMVDVSAYFVLFTFVAVISLLLLVFVFKPMAPIAVDSLILRLPLFRDLVMSQNHYITFLTLSRLIDEGVRLEGAFDVVLETTAEGEIKQDLRRAQKALHDGDSQWGSSMKHIDSTDRAALATARQRGQIARALKAVAEMKKASYSSLLKMVVPAIQLFAYFLMAWAGFLIFAVSTIPAMEMMGGQGAL